MGPSFEGVLTIRSNGSAPLNEMTTMPTYGKNYLKTFFSRTKKNFEVEAWYIASETQGLRSLFK